MEQVPIAQAPFFLHPEFPFYNHLGINKTSWLIKRLMCFWNYPLFCPAHAPSLHQASQLDQRAGTPEGQGIGKIQRDSRRARECCYWVRQDPFLFPLAPFQVWPAHLRAPRPISLDLNQKPHLRPISPILSKLPDTSPPLLTCDQSMARKGEHK
jgi:hypothetical protein